MALKLGWRCNSNVYGTQDLVLGVLATVLYSYSGGWDLFINSYYNTHLWPSQIKISNLEHKSLSYENIASSQVTVVLTLIGHVGFGNRLVTRGLGLGYGC